MSGNIPPYAQFGTNTVPPFQAAPIRVEDSAPDYMLEIRQQPQHARVALGKDKDRKPIDPPPILQLKVSHRKDPMQNFLQSPYFFMSCNLLKGDETPGREPQPSSLIGTVVSSLHRLKDTDNQDGGFFVFGDLSCKVEGRFRLLFSLYQMQKTDCYHITSIVSDVFQVYPTKSFPGLAESTFLTRSFSDQGVRLRLRKDSRSTSSRKRNATVAAFSRKGHGHSDTDNGSSRGLPSRSSTLDSGGLGYGSMGRGATAAESYDAQASAYAATHGYGATATDLTAYGAPRGYGAASMGMPVSTAAAYSMSPLATTSTATLAYGMATTAPTHSRHPLSRIETQLAAAAAAAQGGGAGFPSPASRQSPHAYGYTMQPSPSPGEYRGEYRTHASALYVGGLSAEASPRTHPTPNPHQAASSGAGTSPPEATTANYTAVGVGSMAPYSQGLSPYSYGLGEAQTLPPPSMGMRPHGPPTLDLQGGLGLELGYDVERQH